MNESFWGWCPDAKLETASYSLSPYGFKGVADVKVDGLFAVIKFRLTDAVMPVAQDVSYRVYQLFIADSEAHVPADIAPRLFPVCASEREEAIDMFMDGIEQINKYFAKAMKMNEYHDDITHLMQISMGILDYFIGYLSHLGGDLGESMEDVVRELKFKRS